MSPSSDPAARVAAALALARAQQEHMRHFVHRKVVERPDATRALFLAPHPDDIVIGCGGTLLAMIDADVPVRLAYLTDGRAVAEPGGEDEMAARRADEARRVSAALGLVEPVLFGWNEHTFTRPESEPELVAALAGLLASEAPDAVFVPYLWDQHGDHRYTNWLLARAMEESGARPTVYGYEVWSFAPPGIVVDVTRRLERKKEILSLYASQLELLDYLTIVDVRARQHASLAPGAEACEVFCPFRADAFLERVHEADLRSPEALCGEVLLTPPESAP